jgi:hypothetical protein
VRPDPELLRVEFVGATLTHDPRALGRDVIAGFFSDVSERYGFERLELLPEGGAGLAGESGAELILRPDQVTSCSVTGLGYHEGRERVAGAMSEALERFGPDDLAIDDVTLVATWECGDEDEVRRILAAGLAGDGQEAGGLFDHDEASMGLRVWRPFGPGSLECAIEPVHAEPWRLYVRLVYAQRDPVADVGAVTDRLDAVREFLLGPVADFVLARAAR